ncbi:unnamed protein product [Lactuca virosa]|uniref:F-box/LRR-repeat protein 15/At3g58940/PEG3-like LRR domain-containing protein n=1 Tax=Lactuca virosa TaxID=75947 RepID=A0AAU9MUS8_9ASTR|nr:unnamed protein product [Lactuca virosa]
MASGYSLWMTTSQRPVINCVSLRELHLKGVSIGEEVLHDLLSSCTLLEKIALIDSCKEFKTLKVKNLPRLYELRIALDAASSTALEVSDVPNLDLFSCDLHGLRPYMPLIPFNAHSVFLTSNVRQLRLDVVIQDYECLDMIKSGLPFLDSFDTFYEILDVGKLPFHMCFHQEVVLDVVQKQPNRHTISSLKHTTITLSLPLPVDANFFLKMRETLTLSRKCYLSIITAYFKEVVHEEEEELPLDIDIDIDELRKRLLFPPARNVQQMSFQTGRDQCMWERSLFFDAFFEICHPEHVFANSDIRFRNNNHFRRLMLREVLEKKTKPTD